MSAWVRVLGWGYGRLLRLYPRAHWAAFGRERVWVFEQAAEEAARRGARALVRFCLREGVDLPASIVEAHWTANRRRGAMENVDRRRTAAEGSGERGAWAASLAALAPLVYMALWSVWCALPGVAPASGSGVWIALAVRGAGYLGLLGGLVVGWVRGFPRWSYAYLLSVPLIGLLSGAIRLSPDELLGWRALIPLGVAAASALLLTRSLRPLRRLVQGVRADWTQLSFALYSLMPILVRIAFDEVADRFELPFMVATNLVLIGGALAYVRSATPRRRALVLVDGLALAWMATAVGTAVYWHGRMVGRGTRPLHWAIGARPPLIALFVLVALLLAPALLGVVRRST